MRFNFHCRISQNTHRNKKGVIYGLKYYLFELFTYLFIWNSVMQKIQI